MSTQETTIGFRGSAFREATYGAIKCGLRSSKQKYERGQAACGKCQQGSHQHCRPRIDNTLCTCSCELAQTYRERLAELRQQRPEMSEQECVIAIAPKFRASHVGGDRFAAVDRTKQNPFKDL